MAQKEDDRFPDPLPGSPTCSANIAVTYDERTGACKFMAFCPRDCYYNKDGRLPTTLTGTAYLPGTTTPVPADLAREKLVGFAKEQGVDINRRCRDKKATMN